MLKEITGDLVEDKTIDMIIRDGYGDGFPDSDINRMLFEKYPKLSEHDENEYKDYGDYCGSGRMTGVKLDDGRTLVTWYAGPRVSQPDYDVIVSSANLFNQYRYNRDAYQKITVGVPEGICGKEWLLVRQAIEEIAGHQPQDEFVIVKDIKLQGTDS